MILFAIYSVSQIRILEEFARRLPEAQPFFFLSFNDSREVNDRLQQSADKLNTKLEILSDLSKQVEKSALPRLRRQLGPKHAYGKVPINEAYCKLLLGQILACDELLTANDVNMVIVCEDGPGGCGPLIAAAKRRNILVAEMPFGIGEMRDYEIFIDSKATSSALNLVPDNETGAAIRKFAPHWIKQTRYGDVTLFPADFILARLATGLDIPEPWVVHGGAADVLLVESEAMERIYKRENVPGPKRVLTGSCYADAVFDVIMEKPELRQAYELAALIDPEKPRVLISLPPSYHEEYIGKSEFSTYREVIEKMLAGCRAAHPQVRITVSIHPAIQPEARQIITELADEVSEEWLLRLIPKNDVFFTVFSSTTRWALMCGKPIVNYDIYKFELPTYDTAPCVFTANVLQDALKQLQTILGSPEAYHDAAQQVKTLGHEWGMMDGQNFNRIWKVLQERKESTGEFQWFRWPRLLNLLGTS